jgi:hypothetical protein
MVICRSLRDLAMALLAHVPHAAIDDFAQDITRILPHDSATIRAP